MVNYLLGKIYKIVDLDSNKCYIGSTCEPTLAKRLANHVSEYKRFQKGKVTNCTSYIILELDDYDIVLIEDYPCNSKVELHARERYYSQLLPCVNKNKNQGLINELGRKEYKKQYRELNKVKFAEYNDANRGRMNEKCQCSCGGKYTFCQKARHYRSDKNIKGIEKQIIQVDC